MNIFISYSVTDKELVKQVADPLRPFVDNVFWWEESKEPGKEAWPTIFSWIDKSDLILAVITDHAISRAMAIGQEIGHAKAKNKEILPLVASTVDSKDLGCLSGITYQPIDQNNLNTVIKAAQKKIEVMKKSEEERKNSIGIGLTLALGLAIGLIALSGSK
jgi:hypothetical protein